MSDVISEWYISLLRDGGVMEDSFASGKANQTYQVFLAKVTRIPIVIIVSMVVTRKIILLSHFFPSPVRRLAIETSTPPL
jgi:hypothetical protein